MKSKKRNTKKNNRQRDLVHYIDPPRFASVTQITRTYGFIVTTSNFNGLITVQNLIGISGLVCTVLNTTVAQICSSVKIHSIEVWTQATTAGTGYVACSIQAFTMNNVPSREVSGATANPSRPAYVRYKPRQGEYLHQAWGNQNALNALELAAPVGSIIHVRATHWMYDIGTLGQTYAITSGVLGVVGYGWLDGAGPGAKLQPTGLPFFT